MRINFFFILLTAIICLLLVSCDRPECRNTDLLFDNYAPDYEEYKCELAKQLTLIDKSKLRYWMGVYREDKYNRSILVHIQSDSLCAKIILLIKESDKGIEWLIKHKGMGYCGAELEDLKFDIVQDSVKTEFVFKEISGIID